MMRYQKQQRVDILQNNDHTGYTTIIMKKTYSRNADLMFSKVGLCKFWACIVCPNVSLWTSIDHPIFLLVLHVENGGMNHSNYIYIVIIIPFPHSLLMSTLD